MDRVVRRGDVWEVDLDPARGHEQGGRRPCVVVSSDLLHAIPSQLAMLLPITKRDRGVPSHVAFDPPEGGATARSFILCEQLRTVSQATLDEVVWHLRRMLDLP